MSNKIIINTIKKYILSNLEDRIKQITSSNKINVLSDRDLTKLMTFMRAKKKYSTSLVKYIYRKSICKNERGKYIESIKDTLLKASITGNVSLVKYVLSNEVFLNQINYIE